MKSFYFSENCQEFSKDFLELAPVFFFSFIFYSFLQDQLFLKKDLITSNIIYSSTSTITLPKPAFLIRNSGKTGHPGCSLLFLSRNFTFTSLHCSFFCHWSLPSYVGVSLTPPNPLLTSHIIWHFALYFYCLSHQNISKKLITSYCYHLPLPIYCHLFR